MKTWHKHTSSLRNERSGRRSRPQSERRNSYRTRAKRTTRRTVGLCDGMLLLLCATCTTRWPMTSRQFEKRYGQNNWRTANSFWNIGWVFPNYRERQVRSTSVWKDNAERESSWAVFHVREEVGQETWWWQTMQICVNQKPQEFTCANGTLSFPNRPRPSLPAEGNLEPEDDVEIEEGDNKGSTNRRFVVYEWRIYLSTSWKTSFDVLRPR